ncbi:serine/threonine-protein kinase [Candidatus Uabimicrobium amorphum]|uniref:Serine/threonine-protein kinase PrkC n=1 Tax=Uabimicrobium amorphum TaxID=2596890 RepID=A0A5S9ISF6_UABAM|nr:serine/threonine-protein kinase [Candidatus Uabimicrobium amorphum]BBM85825.1 serine/threonine-protein kinase PrkC [Candidatus Uabimicrobium amorphum]
MSQPHFPGFEVIKPLGKGGMGEVYLVREVSTSRLFALKTILGEHKNKRGYKRFLREAQTYAQLEHENIVRIYRLEHHQENSFIIMQYVEGWQLNEYLANNSLSLTEKLRLFKTIVSAVGALHDKHIVHRDLKPANIMIDKNHRPYLMDFGLVKRIDSKQKSLTREGDVIGSPKYMSPEQASGKKVEYTSDLYSLGTIFFEMLTSKPFIEGDSAVSIMFEILHGEMRYPRKINSNIPPAVEAICVKCLRKDKGKRYATTADLLVDLENYEEGVKVKAQNVNFWFRLNQKTRRYSTQMYIVFAVALLAGFFFFQKANREKWLRDFSKEQAKKVLEEKTHDYLTRALYLNAVGSYTRALEVLLRNTNTKSAVEQKQRQILMGKTYYKMKNYEKARQQYRKVLDTFHESEDFDREYLQLLINKCSLYLKEKNSQRNMQAFLKQVRSPLLIADAQYHLAFSYKEEIENGLQFYKKADIHESDENVSKIQSAVDLFLQAKKSILVNSYGTQDWLEEIDIQIGNAYLLQWQITKQEPLLEKAKTYLFKNESPQRNAAIAKYYQLLDSKRNLAKAIEHYTKAIALDPLNARLYQERGQCYAQQNNFHKSERDYLQAVDLEPDNFFVMLLLFENCVHTLSVDNKQETLKMLVTLVSKQVNRVYFDIFAERKSEFRRALRANKTTPYNKKDVYFYLEKLTQEKSISALAVNALECVDDFEKVIKDLDKKFPSKNSSQYIRKIRKRILLRGYIDLLIRTYMYQNKNITHTKVRNLQEFATVLLEIVTGDRIVEEIFQGDERHLSMLQFLTIRALVDLAEPRTRNLLDEHVQKTQELLVKEEEVDAQQLNTFLLCKSLMYSNDWPYDIGQGIEPYKKQIKGSSRVLTKALTLCNDAFVKGMFIQFLPIEFDDIFEETMRGDDVTLQLYAAKKMWQYAHLAGGEVLKKYALANNNEGDIRAFACEALYGVYSKGLIHTRSESKIREMQKFCEQITPQVLRDFDRQDKQKSNVMALWIRAITGQASKHRKEFLAHIDSPKVDAHIKLQTVSLLGIGKNMQMLKEITGKDLPLIFRVLGIVSLMIDSREKGVGFGEAIEMLNILRMISASSQDNHLKNLLLIYGSTFQFFQQQMYEKIRTGNDEEKMGALIALYGTKKIMRSHLTAIEDLAWNSSNFSLRRTAAATLATQMYEDASLREKYMAKFLEAQIDGKPDLAVHEGAITGSLWQIHSIYQEKVFINDIYHLDMVKIRDHAEFEKMNFCFNKVYSYHIRRFNKVIWPFIDGLIKISPDISLQLQDEVLLWKGLIHLKKKNIAESLTILDNLRTKSTDKKYLYWTMKAHRINRDKEKASELLLLYLQKNPWDYHVQVIARAYYKEPEWQKKWVPHFRLLSLNDRHRRVDKTHAFVLDKSRSKKQRIDYAKRSLTLANSIPIYQRAEAIIMTTTALYSILAQLEKKERKHYHSFSKNYLVHKSRFVTIDATKSLGARSRKYLSREVLELLRK